jgi:nucleotide-binding universal stress UspA family protein
MYHDILIPTDGGDASTAALDHAFSLATQYGARVHALYVVDSGAYGLLEEGASAVIDALYEEGERAVEAIATDGRRGDVDVETVVLDGNVHRSILDYADENDVDLIVMGTHGRRGIDRYLLGSATERVVRSSPVPVLTVRAPDQDEE